MGKLHTQNEIATYHQYKYGVSDKSDKTTQTSYGAQLFGAPFSLGSFQQGLAFLEGRQRERERRGRERREESGEREERERGE